MSVLVLNICMDANMPLTINSFRQLFPDKIFSPDTSLTFSKFTDSCQIPWHFQVFQTSGHPVYSASPWTHQYAAASCMSVLISTARHQWTLQAVSDIQERRHLRSATLGLLDKSRYKLETYGRRAFSYAGPSAWNSLPAHLRSQNVTIDNFMHSLKTFLFSQMIHAAH